MNPLFCKFTIKLWDDSDTGWDFPAFVPDENGCNVVAELLEVTPQTLARIDVLEGFSRLYGRETVLAKLADGSMGPAIVYILKKLPEGAKVIAGGNWQKAQSEE